MPSLLSSLHCVPYETILLNYTLSRGRCVTYILLLWGLYRGPAAYRTTQLNTAKTQNYSAQMWLGEECKDIGGIH